MHRAHIDTLAIFDKLRIKQSFSDTQTRQIIDLITKINSENQLVFASKYDLSKLETRLLRKIFYMLTLFGSILTSIIK